MDATQRMDALNREWCEAEASRVAVLVRATALIEAGDMTVEQVAVALGISSATWYRWANAYRLRELAAECARDLDTALRQAGATEDTTATDVATDPDLEFAAGTRGVWQR